MRKIKKDIDETAMSLKYPDYRNWRDLDAALQNGGFWSDGEPVRLSDPEMQPFFEELKEKVKTDPEYAKEMLRKINILPTYIA